MVKERIDLLLVQKALCSSREQAQRTIMAGHIFVNQERIDKPGTRVLTDAMIEVKGAVHPYVSRGGMKLAKALEVFNLDVNGLTAIDVGASTGGFTDCLLQNGANLVYAVDIGYAQLAWKLRQDERVIEMERCNFLQLTDDDLKHGQPQFATVDVAFISVCKIFPNLKKILAPLGYAAVLIKPQFEAGKAKIGKKGLVKDILVHQEVLENVICEARSIGFSVLALDFSPIKGGRTGNVEFLALLYAGLSIDTNINISEVVRRAHLEVGNVTDRR